MKTPYSSKSVPSPFDSALDAASGHIVDYVDASSPEEKARHLDSAIGAIRPVVQILAYGKIVKAYRDKGMALQESEDLAQEAIKKMFEGTMLGTCTLTINKDRSKGLKVSGEGSRLNGLLRRVAEWRLIDVMRKNTKRLADLARNDGVDVESVQIVDERPELNSNVEARARQVMQIEEEFLKTRIYKGKPMIAHIGDWRLTKEMAGLMTTKSRPPKNVIPPKSLGNINNELIDRIRARMGPSL